MNSSRSARFDGAAFEAQLRAAGRDPERLERALALYRGELLAGEPAGDWMLPVQTRLRDRYVLRRAGGAAGFGVGPIVVARDARPVAGRIAIPGERTTAAMLLRLLGRFETVPMRFDRIEAAVLSGEVDCGLLIHEGPFTYEARGLTLLTDLGAVWEERMQCPLPLAAIAIRRDLAPAHAARMDHALRASVEFAFTHPGASADYVRQHAQEMDPDVTARHIHLYVNDYTRALDERAVHTMAAWAEREGLSRPGEGALPMFLSAVPAGTGAGHCVRRGAGAGMPCLTNAR